MVAALYASQAIAEPQELDHLPMKDKSPDLHGVIKCTKKSIGCGVPAEKGSWQRWERSWRIADQEVLTEDYISFS
jgi:hypothetical protein